MREQLSKLEGQLENLFEGLLANLIGEELSAGTLASQLARTMEDGLRRDDAGHAFAPNEFALTMNPEDASRLVDQAPDIQAVLSRDVAQAAERCGYSLTHQPSIMLASDPILDRREVRVISWHSSNPLEFTKAMEKQPMEGAVQLPKGAFLILGDGRHFSLDKPVINVGRRIDNQIVLEDAYVSRTHAQLRVRDRRYVLFDLVSTGGTNVNGRQVKQHILRPGDVITIAESRMVYGEDEGASKDTSTAYTPPFPPWPAGDQDTETDSWNSKEGR